MLPAPGHAADAAAIVRTVRSELGLAASGLGPGHRSQPQEGPHGSNDAVSCKLFPGSGVESGSGNLVLAPI